VRVVDDPDESSGDRAEPALAKAAAGIVGAAAGIRLGPGMALVFGAAGPLFEGLAVKSWQEFWTGAQRRAGEMLETAADEAGLDAEELADRIAGSDQAQLQTAIAMAAAERTTWPPQVKALGKVLAEGLIAEGDAVDLPQFALEAMADLGRLHVSLLDLLVRYEPGVASDGTSPRPYQPTGGDWMAGRRSWAERWILEYRPHLQPVLTSVVGSLVRHGLAHQTDRTPEAMEQLGKDFQGQINRQASLAKRTNKPKPPTLRPPVIRRIERSWSPTELGERVLGYYIEAGAGS
jgi:hypothetical protein